MATFQVPNLPSFTMEDLEEKKERKAILNYLAMMDEKLRYMFYNLDPEENFSTEAFQSYVSNGEKTAQLKLTVDGLTVTVTDGLSGLASQMELTAGQFSVQIQDINGNLSNVTQTVSAITSTVGSIEGQMSQVSQRADMIYWLVADDTSASRFTLTSRAARLIAEEIELYGSVTFRDLERGGRTVINGDNISTGSISAEYIHLGGFMEVYRTPSSNTIGGYIGYGSGNNGERNTQGIMMASRDEYSYFIATDSGVRMTYDDRFSIYCTDEGIVFKGRMNYHADTYFYCEVPTLLGSSSYPWRVVYAQTGTINTSDERQKNSINYDMRRYEEFYKRLKPVHYKMNDGTSERFHIGFIAQDVEADLKEAGLESTDFAGFIKSPVYEEQRNVETYEELGNPTTLHEKPKVPHEEPPKAEAQLVETHEGTGEITDYRYALRYTEFVALNTHMIQKLTKRVEELEAKINEG